MDHYTYLLGAGASAPTLPVNKGLLKRLHDIITLGPNHLNELKYQSYLRYFKMYVVKDSGRFVLTPYRINLALLMID